MYFRYFVIISPWKRAGHFIWTNLNSLDPRMLCAKFGWNWPSGSGEEDENVKSLQTDGRTDRQTDGQTDRQTDDGRQVIRKAHLSFQLRWAKNSYIWSKLFYIWNSVFFIYFSYILISKWLKFCHFCPFFPYILLFKCLKCCHTLFIFHIFPYLLLLKYSKFCHVLMYFS